MAALRAKLSVELLPIDEECLLKRAAGALATYSAFVARERAKSTGLLVSYRTLAGCRADFCAGAALINFAAAA